MVQTAGHHHRDQIFLLLVRLVEDFSTIRWSMDENFLRHCYTTRSSEQQQQHQNHRYTRFNDHRSFQEAQSSNNVPEPIDHYHLIYFALFCCGIGFLLPYSIYITCVDYFHSQFPQTAIIFHLNFIYILVAFTTVVFSNIIANILSVQRRVIFGYSLTLIILMFITVFCVGLEIFPQKWSYSIFLLSVGILAVGCTRKFSSSSSKINICFFFLLKYNNRVFTVWPVCYHRVILKLWWQEKVNRSKRFYSSLNIDFFSFLFRFRWSSGIVVS